MRLPGSSLAAVLCLLRAACSGQEPVPAATPAPRQGVELRVKPLAPEVVPPPLSDLTSQPSPDTSILPPKEAKRGDLIVAPFPISNPTVGTGLGVYGTYIFRIDREDTVSPPTTASAVGFATSSGSGAGVVFMKTYLGKDRWRLMGVLGYGVAAVDFYGVGSDAGDTGASVPLDQTGKFFLVEGMTRVFPRLFAGLRYQKGSLDTEVKGEIPPEFEDDLPAQQFRTDSGALGLRAQFDSRDDTFYPRGGEYLDLAATVFSPTFGGDETFQKYQLQLNAYRTIAPMKPYAAVFAARLSFCGISGEAPFHSLCLFGTNSDIRGYKGGQYRDKVLVAGQVEVRKELSSKFGAAVFAGLGEVAPAVDELSSTNVLFGGGVGIRYRVAKENHLNLRIDYAWGKGQSGVYVGVGEAF